MSKIFIEYVYDCFDEADVMEISQVSDFYNVDACFHERRPCIVNAALDELVETVLLLVNSSELQTGIAIYNIASALASVAKKMWEILQSKKLQKVTSSTIEEKEANIIIQVDNVKIILKNASEEELGRYLHTALVESKKVAEERENYPIIINGDSNVVNVYTLEEFAKKTIGVENRTIRTVSCRKYGRRKK